MKKYTIPFITFISCLFLVAVAANAQEATNRIKTMGTGIVYGAPDIARISVGVEEMNMDAQTAIATAANDMQSIIETLKASGVSDNQIQTTDISLDLRYDYRDDKREFLGYVAGSTLQVQFEDFELLGAVIPVLVEAGADRLSRINFDIQDKSKMLDEARKLAYADARVKAEAISAFSGIQLGKTLVIEVHEDRDIAPMMMAESFARDSSADMPIEGGQISVSSTVSLEIELSEE